MMWRGILAMFGIVALTLLGDMLIVLTHVPIWLTLACVFILALHVITLLYDSLASASNKND
jgi:hypothetical protein